MNRLTKNNDTQYDLVGKWDTNIKEFTLNHKLRNDLLNKLGELEDIEEELGIDLITLFKIIKQKYVYTNSFNRRVEEFVFTKIEGIEKDHLGRTYLRIVFQEVEYDENGNEKYGICWIPNLKDYGKTWSLNREELERNSLISENEALKKELEND